MDDQQDRFAERVKRIQERKVARPPAPPEMGDVPPLPLELPPMGPEGMPPGGGGGSGFGVIRLALILVVFVALLGFGGLYLKDTLGKTPGGVADASEPAQGDVVAGAPREVSPILTFVVERPKEDPEAPLAVQVDRGWILRPGLVANSDSTEIAVTDIVSGYDPNTPDLVPAEIEMFDANTGCTLRRPAPGEVVHNVRIEHGTGPTDIHVVSSAGMAEALKGHIEGVTTGRKQYLIGKTADGRMDRVDVFVTDTSAPVYLVLQNISGNTLWNVHRGPGAQIAHVALIGNTSGAVLPADIGLEALRISDFVAPHEFGAYDTIEPCMIRPFRKPEPGWRATIEGSQGNQLLANQMHTYSTGFAAFNDWYKKTLGIDADTNVVSIEAAAHVLVGPRPVGQVGYNLIGREKVHLVRTDRVYQSEEALIEAHLGLLNAAAGGDALTIDPVAMERKTQ